MGWISRGACFGVMVTAIFYYWLYSGPQVSQTWKDTYEYIVVGAGSAGGVVATRLAEHGHSVLVLEAGGEDKGLLSLSMPFGCAEPAFSKEYTWSTHKTTPQQFCGKAFKNRQLATQHGRVLGGGSSVNYMMYVRGHKQDFDSWEKHGATGWDWENVKKYFKRAENIDSEGDDFGHNGPIGITENEIKYELTTLFINASVELGMKRNPTYNNGQNQGVSFVQKSAKDGKRSSVAACYLRPAMSRSNLDVLVRKHVTKILFEGKKAIGVEFLDTSGRRYKVFANKEVILSASAINSPQILMLSGVGPKDELIKHNIPVIHHLPGVGQNYQDHPVYSLYSIIENTNVAEAPDMEEAANPLTLLNWLVNGKGLLALGPAAAHVFMDVKDGQAVYDETTAPKLQTIFMPFLGGTEPEPLFAQMMDMWGVDDEQKANFADNHGYSGFTLDSVILHPHSRGNITLRSSDPLDSPNINPNIFSDQRDKDTMIAGYKFYRKLLETKTMEPLAPYERNVKHPTRNPACREFSPLSEEYIRCIVEYHTFLIWHPAGSCKMGTDEMAVVDPQLRVHGIENLRVVDNSVMPHLTSGNTNAPAIMIGEKAAAMILGED